MNRFFSRLKTFLLNTWVLALVIFLPFYFLIPVKLNKYAVEISREELQDNEKSFYRDLDGDGLREKINLHLGNFLYFIMEDFQGADINQWNFPHEPFPYFFHLFFHDLDKNGGEEILGFTRSSDTVFLNVIEPLGKDPTFKTFMIGNFPARKGYNYEIYLSNLLFTDLNTDGYPEVVFTLRAGFNLHPRKIYALDYRTGKVVSSSAAGITLERIWQEDMDEDGLPEIFGRMQNSLNLPPGSGTPYSDSCAWLMVYDHNLNHRFPPLPFPATFATVITHTGFFRNQKYFYTFFAPEQKLIGRPVIIIHDAEGKIIRTDTLDFLPATRNIDFIKKNDREFYLVHYDGLIFRINSEAKVLDQAQVPNEVLESFLCDLQEDGEPELILVKDNAKNLIILADDMRFFSIIDFLPDETYSSFTWLENGLFYFTTDRNEYFVKYKKEPLFYLQYPLYAGIYLSIALILFLVKKNQETRTREKYEFMNEVRSLEMRAFRNQMDPHFTLNVFNILSSLLASDKTEEAQKAFKSFSALIRQNLERSEELVRTLGEELEAVESFLAISKLRFGEKINYEIGISEPELKRIQVPKMIILTHVENAVKHGLIPKSGPGRIKISINREMNDLIVIVEDDGIGRKRARETGTGGTGIGMELLRKLIDHLNKRHGIKITQEITDLEENNGNPCGTKIMIKLPLNLQA